MEKILKISNPSSFEPNETSISTKNIIKSFGRPEDHIELYIYDLQDNLLQSDSLFKDYYIPDNPAPSTPLNPTNIEPEIVNPAIKGAGEKDYDSPGPNNAKEGYWFNTGAEKIWVSTLPSQAQGALEGLSSEISLDPIKALKDRGYATGKYKVKFNINRKKIFNIYNNPFSIKEISTNRREIRTVTPSITNDTLSGAVGAFIAEIESSVYFKEFYLNFGEDINLVGINILLNKNTPKYEVLIKTLDPIPSFISTQTNFKICEYIVDPIIFTVDLGEPIIEDKVIPLRGPNTEIDIRTHNSIPSNLKNFNQVLDYSLSSSYDQLLNRLEKQEIPKVDYDYIRPVSKSWGSFEEESYHFENFVHFGSAVERLNNFKYKVERIEFFNSQSSNLSKGNIADGSSTSSFVLDDKESYHQLKQDMIKSFDGYEYFLYYTSGSYAWPKSNSTKPYILHSPTSSIAKTWLGDHRDSFPDYGGQLLSASLFDRQNNYSLDKLIPNHIITNNDNNFYIKFVNMIGQHFDKIWLHIKHITELNDTHHVRGISKDLVYFVLRGLGLETFDQFENANLIEYILGEGIQDHTVGNLQVGQYIVGGNSSQFYNTPRGITNYVTSSNEGSIPKGDITREIWKRLYHNAPYLLKTKGTERGLRALMNCYGIPTTTLNVKEYGGPTKDKTTYKTFTYDKSSFALKGDSGTGGYFLKTDWSSSLTDTLSSSAKTVEFRIKPVRSDSNYHLFSLSSNDDNQKNAEPILTLTPYTGNDISSSGDSTQYGKLDLYLDGNISSSTANFPIYNGDFWNIYIGTPGTSGSASEIQFGAYQTNWLKNTSYYTATSSMRSEYSRSVAWGDPYSSSAANGAQCIGGANFAYIGGTEANGHTVYDSVDGLRYSGSIQEVKFHFGEMLSHDTLVKHSLDPFMYGGNQISSSYDTIVSRLPLGSNLHKNSSSFHPRSEDKNYIPGITSSFVNGTLEWEEIDEVHHLPTPDTGISTTSEKIRIDTGSIDDNILAHNIRSETSILDRVPQDFEDLGIFFSPTTEINEDIIYTLGAFRLDDYIGSPLPTVQSSSYYRDLIELKEVYFKKIKNRYKSWDYIKLIQEFDHTLFKLIEQWVPFKANTKTGLLFEPHFLDRSKVSRTVPTKTDGQSMVSGSYNTFEVEFTTFASEEKVVAPNLPSNGKVDPRYQDKFRGSKLFKFDSVVGGGNVVTTNNWIIPASGKPHSGSNGLRFEQGTNATIGIKDLYKFEKEHAQAPIIPNSTGSKQLKRISNTLLGNVQKGKLSRRYYRSLAPGNQNNYYLL